MDEKELKQWLRMNEERAEKGMRPMERTLYHESVLQIAVYDEKDDGGRGTCIGCIIWGQDEMKKFFDADKACIDWYPLGKDEREKTDRKEILAGSETGTRNPTLGKDSTIQIGTPALEYVNTCGNMGI